MKKILFIIFALMTFTLNAQVKYSIDTSFTPHSTYLKEVKKYPNIKIKTPQEFKSVKTIADIPYKNTATRPLHLDAFLPKKGKNHTAIVMIHGGGWKSGNKTNLKPLAQTLTSLGYACFPVEYQLSLEAKYPEGVYDVKNAIQFVIENHKKFKIDTTKMVILGCSSGGQMAALIGTTNNNPKFQDSIKKNNHTTAVQAIIDVDGILAFHHPQSAEGTVASFWLGGTYEEKPEIWEEASALNHTDSQTPPTLFINSQFERFHAGRDDMIAILKKNNIDYEIKYIENSPHPFWLLDPYFDQTVKYINDFLNKIFKNKKEIDN
ncbi:alpha/beta hydrolase [Flavobacterium agrisoli]|uniref:Alpha/beta hydrolase n=1 Tax=Flavobacterium agrisoli TaxID=2793066 RepID=A0A934PQG1_9FLAO|nr:alpha/beta hydrolase [Flavobacterium agrisoli]MBK0370753.1 alpha/beta hydrolase [Flavobacterium agrisoli]